MMLTQETIELYRNSLLDANLSENTAKGYSKDLEMFLEWVALERGVHPYQVGVPMEELDSTARKWLRIQMKIASPRTTRRRITSLKSLAVWAQIPPVLSGYKSPSPPPSQPHPIPGLLASLELLVECAKNSREQALVGLCGFAGLRVHEARMIRPSNIDLSEMTLTVFGKGEKIRYVPISKRCWSAIMSAFVESFENNMLLCEYGDRTARAIVTRMGKTAGLSREISSHDLRATFATVIQSETKDIIVVKDLLGHASITTTQIYTLGAMKAMREAVEF
jgi:integrase/recombinase XerC